MHLLLHIGPYKTGSTSIQNSLQQGREQLEADRILVYRAHKIRDRALVLRFQKNPISDPIIHGIFDTNEDAHAWSEKRWREMENLANSDNYDVAILSSEHFSGLGNPTRMLKRLAKTFDKITVLFYIRDSVDLFCSGIQQRIKGGAKFSDLQKAMRIQSFTRHQLEKFSTILGIENCIVRNFDRGNLVNGDVVDDFKNIAGSILKRDINIPNVRSNEGIAGAGITWLLTVNETYDRVKANRDRQQIIRRLTRSQKLKQFPKLKLTDPDLVRYIRGNSRDNNIWFNENFLSGQKQLPVESQSPTIFSENPDLLWERLHAWFFGYLETDAIIAVANVALNTENSILSDPNSSPTDR